MKKKVIMRVPWLSMPLLILLIFVILNFSIFFFCALSMRNNKSLDVLKEKRNITARSPDDDLDPPDLMTYVLCLVCFSYTLATLDGLSG